MRRKKGEHVTGPSCPRCAAPTVPVVHGYPADPDALDGLLRSGEVDFRGCTLPAGPVPVATCQACGLDLDRQGVPIT